MKWQQKQSLLTYCFSCHSAMLRLFPFSLMFVIFAICLTFGGSLNSFVLPITKAAEWIPSYGSQTDYQRLHLKRDLNFATPNSSNSRIQWHLNRLLGKFRQHLKINKHVTNDHKTWVCLSCGKNSLQDST